MDDARGRRSLSRARTVEAQRRARDASYCVWARGAIRQRLAEVPPLWRRRYAFLLTAHDLRADASLAHVHSRDNLQRRVALLPPQTVYVHMRNPAHPSLPEPRVLRVVRRAQHTRGDNKQACGNRRAFSLSTYTFPDRPNVAKLAPSNVLGLEMADGHMECVNTRVLRKLIRTGHVFALSYQRDARGDHWAEMRVDTERSGTVRLPLWLLEEATGEVWAPGPTRLKPPHETQYAGVPN